MSRSQYIVSVRFGATVREINLHSSYKTAFINYPSVISVQNAESYFDIDEFNDLYAKTKPTLYIKLADVFSIHQLVAAEIANVCPNQDDVLRDVIRELGSVKSNESELMAVGSSEISLTLNPKLHNMEGEKCSKVDVPGFV
jgi:hypothetical protein